MNTVILPRAVTVLLDRLSASGYRADIVGGCVRDMLLGKIPHDFDITTDATPEQMKRVFADMRTVETGIQHGTLTVLSDGEPYEITTYRVDGVYEDHRHPVGVSFTSRLADDLSRRDFTVNAMCYHPARGLTDLFGGAEDLRARVLRCVGDAAVRFEEDALRILRALRFSATLGFAIEPLTAAAIHEKKHLLHAVSAERIYTEIKKLIMGENAPHVLSEYRDVLEEILPVLRDLQIHVDIILYLPTFPSRFCALLAFAPDRLERFRAACDILRADNELRRFGERLLPLCREATGDARSLLSLLAALGEEDTEHLLRLRHALGTDAEDAVPALHALLATSPVYTVRELAINGRDVAAFGYHGEQIGAQLAAALRAVMDGACPNTREDLLNFVRCAEEARKGGNHGL